MSSPSPCLAPQSGAKNGAKGPTEPIAREDVLALARTLFSRAGAQAVWKTTRISDSGGDERAVARPGNRGQARLEKAALLFVSVLVALFPIEAAHAQTAAHGVTG